ncbi:MAPEG family protein [Phenylobacterium sp.]|uniref:MAPEG family protein n=1 Tax=Phenylobacterium sp. TaxID=1871053 RepID=UPI00271B6EFA|nr:MAPEG family protein [Phenylobacterium sp.]MDO8379772.1 MAPEG family protein [Phenylobacterium sp.]
MNAAPELQLIGAAIIVGAVQLLWAAGAARAQQDLKWAAGPRDEDMPLTGVAARLDRAFKNFMETFPFFVAAVFAAYLVAKTGPLTLWGAGLYVVSRALYAPLYAAGISGVRTLVWLVSLVGIGMIVAAIFLA